MIFSENRYPARIKSGPGFFGIMLYRRHCAAVAWVVQLVRSSCMPASVATNRTLPYNFCGFPLKIAITIETTPSSFRNLKPRRGALVGALPMAGRTMVLAKVRACRQGWSKHELAHLHSAAELMRAGGMSIRTDRGVTDEGDPWFVFCVDETGEVIAHFARIDGKYIACVPFRSGALTEPILPDLIEQFLQQHKFLPQHTGAQPLSIRMRSTPGR